MQGRYTTLGGKLSMTSQRRVLELAVLGLESERRRLDAELADIRIRLSDTTNTQARTVTGNTPTVGRHSPNKGKRMTAAQRKKISQAMKARWAGLKRPKAA